MQPQAEWNTNAWVIVATLEGGHLALPYMWGLGFAYPTPYMNFLGGPPPCNSGIIGI